MRSFTIIHTEIRKDFERLMQHLEEEGYLWGGGSKPTYGIQFYSNYKDRTCVRLRHSDKKLFYGKIETYEEDGYPIISLDSYLPTNKPEFQF